MKLIVERGGGKTRGMVKIVLVGVVIGVVCSLTVAWAEEEGPPVGAEQWKKLAKEGRDTPHAVMTEAIRQQARERNCEVQ